MNQRTSALPCRLSLSKDGCEKMLGARMICLGDSSILYKLNNDNESVNNLCLWRQGLSNYEGDEDQLLIVPASALSMDSDWLRADLADIVAFAELSRIDNPPDVVKSHRVRKQTCDLPIHKSVSVSSTYLRNKKDSVSNLSVSSSVLKQRDSNSNLVDAKSCRRLSHSNSRDSVKRQSRISVTEKSASKDSVISSRRSNPQLDLGVKRSKPSHSIVTRKVSAVEVSRRVDDRQRPGRDRQMDEKYRKLEEIKQQAAATQRFREEQDSERQRRLEDQRRRDVERRMFVENRRSVEADRGSLRRNDERETRLEVRRKNEQGSIGLAFGSTNTQSCDTNDSSWARRSTSTYNVAAASTPERENVAPRTLAPSKEESLRNRAKSLLSIDSVGSIDRSKQHDVSLSMYEIFQWTDPDQQDPDLFVQSNKHGRGVDENARLREAAPAPSETEFSQLYRKTFEAASRKLGHMGGHIHGSGCEVIDESMSQSFHGSGGSAFRHRTDIMPTLPSPHRDLRPRSGNNSLTTSMHEHVAPKSPTRRSLQHASNSRSMSHINELPKKPVAPPRVENLKKVAGHRSMGNLGPGQEQVTTPTTEVQRKTSLSTPRLTRAERLRQRARQVGADKKKVLTPETSSGLRSGDVTPTTPSRPLSAMSYRSHSGSSGAVSMRPRPATASRRPRPASMAGTGILLSTAEHQPEKKEEKKEEVAKTPRPRLPTIGPKPSRAKSMDLLGSSPKPLSTYRKPRSSTKTAEAGKLESKPPTRPQDVKSEKTFQKPEIKTPKPELKAKPLLTEKPKSATEVKGSPKGVAKTKSATPAPSSAKVKPASTPKEESKSDVSVVPSTEVLEPESLSSEISTASIEIPEPPSDPVPVLESEVAKEEAVEAVMLEPAFVEPVPEQQNSSKPKVSSEELPALSKPKASSEENPATVKPKVASEEIPASGKSKVASEEIPTSGKPKITSEEGAKAAIAEKRRLAREQMEREAEAERQRLEDERLADEERLRQEEEQAQRDAEEMERLVAEQRIAEEERLQKAIEEAQRREAEEQLRREEEAQARAEKEVSDKKAREETERLRKENEERLRKEEEARVERKKRVEAIMSRTRGAGAKQGQTESSGDEKSLTSLASESSSDLVSLGDERGSGMQAPSLTDEEIVAMKNEINLNREYAEDISKSLEPNPAEVLNGKSLENGMNGHESVNGAAGVNGGSALIDIKSLEDVGASAFEAFAEVGQETVKPFVMGLANTDLLM